MTRASRSRILFASTCAALTVPMLAACTDNAPSGSTQCRRLREPARPERAGHRHRVHPVGPTAPSGNLTFSVTNGGSKVTEFYLLARTACGSSVRSRTSVRESPATWCCGPRPGSYFTACKPGMIGEGIRAQFAISDSGEDQAPSGNDAELVEQASQSYQSYVKDQTEQLVTKTEEFVDALQGRQGRGGPRAVRAGPGALGADRAGRRVIR